MATVRITETLRGEVYEKARQDFKVRKDKKLAEIKARFDPILVFDTTWRQFCTKYNLTTEFLAAYPSAWCVSGGTLGIRKINGVSNPFGSVQSGNLNQYPRYFFVNVGDSYPLYHEVQSNDLIEQAEVCKEWHTTVAAFDAEEADFHKTVRSLLDNCTTLKQALEAWPQLVDLLSPQTLARHNEPERRYNKNDKPALSQDALDKLNTNLVINKITKAL